MRDALEFYPYPFINAAGETVPAYAIMQVGVGWTEANNRDYFNAVKPNGSGKKFLINSPLAVSTTTNENDGMATDLPGVYVRYTGSTPTAGQEWGPVASSWAIAASGSGYLIIGDATIIDGVSVVRVAAIAATNSTVFEFRNCSDSARRLFLDNPEIGEQEPGTVAVIRIDGVIDCWQLIGAAPRCATGSCAEIIAWGANCDACSVCFYLTPCGGGSPTFVRGVEWYAYVGGVVLINLGGGDACHTVQVADGCFDVTNFTVDDVVEFYAECDACGCYELENCADSEDVIYVTNDLAAIVDAASGTAAIGSFVKRAGVCYEITDFLAPCTETAVTWEDDGIAAIESCSGCCYALTNCADPEDVVYYRLNSDETVNPDDFVNEDGTSNGRVTMLTGYVCRTWSIPETCPEEGVILGLPTILEEFDSCEDCAITCWERCDSPGTFIRTYSDMSDVGPNAAVKRAEDGFCYTRETSPGTCGEPSIVEFTIETIIDEGEDSCEICQDPRVKLTPSCGSGCGDCSGGSSGGSGSGASAIVTDNAAFFEHVGKYIKMDGSCRLVEWTTDALTGTVGCWVGPFDSCAACAAAPSQITVIALIGGEHRNVTLQGVFSVCGQSALGDCEE